MSVKLLTDQIIDELLNGRHTEAIQRTLVLLEGAGLIPAGTELKHFRSVASWEVWYGSTAGPFPGIGGAAMTLFRMTVLHSDTAMLLFANDQFYGAAPYDADVLATRNAEAFSLFTGRMM